MALRAAAKNVRLMAMSSNELVGIRRSKFASSTSPKMKPMSRSIEDAEVAADSTHRADTLKAEYAPVFIVGGFVVVALSIASHTAYQQLARAPNVHLNKKRRETVSEVYHIDHTLRSANKFTDGSVLRKVSHINNKNPVPARTIETLRTVGIDQPTRRI